ncbi:Cell wall / vacuolar inhibitor of fructosidase 2 [Linum grandiflorum]
MSTSFLLPLLLLLLLISIAAAAPTKLVDELCKKTTAYALCVESLYLDPRTPDADRTTMAFISVGLAYQNATGTRTYISGLSGGGRVGRERLKRCGSDYDVAITKMERAYNDLNSETYYGLAELANEAADAAKNCQAVFAQSTWQPMGNRNRVLAVLCEVIAVIGKSFTGED